MGSGNSDSKELEMVKNLFEHDMDWKDGEWQERTPAQCPATGKRRKFAIDLLDNPMFSDVSLLVEGKTIFAHKSKLISSPGFMGMLDQTGSQQIEVTGIDYETMFCLVKFLYTGQLQLDSADQSQKQCIKLLSADSLFWVKGLQEECEDKLIKLIDYKNAINLLIEADKRNLLRLKEHAISFIVHNPELLQSKRCKKLHRRVLIELVNKAASKK